MILTFPCHSLSTSLQRKNPSSWSSRTKLSIFFIVVSSASTRGVSAMHQKAAVSQGWLQQIGAMNQPRRTASPAAGRTRCFCSTPRQILAVLPAVLPLASLSAREAEKANSFGKHYNSCAGSVGGGAGYSCGGTRRVGVRTAAASLRLKSIGQGASGSVGQMEHEGDIPSSMPSSGLGAVTAIPMILAQVFFYNIRLAHVALRVAKVNQPLVLPLVVVRLYISFILLFPKECTHSLSFSLPAVELALKILTLKVCESNCRPGVWLCRFHFICILGSEKRVCNSASLRALCSIFGRRSILIPFMLSLIYYFL
jgi:hypothetical protein